MLEKGAIVFGNWTVEEKIGSGAFGTVYKIKREDFGNFYYAALKVIHIPQDPAEYAKLRSEGMDDESISTYYGQIAQDFIKEIELLSSLDGITNIVDYKDHDIVPDKDFGYTIYIKMQLLTPLSKKLVDSNNQAVFMPAEEILSLGIDICSALEVCEKHKIIHRDIKIDNIFVSANGDYKLGDFGIAKQLEATQGEMSKKGTLLYMAPEVFSGERYNNTADIYSLGIVLYRLLNKNRAPFYPPYPTPIKFSDKECANSKRLKGEMLPEIPDVSAELMSVLRKACAFVPEERYQTAEEFKKALNSILKTLSNESTAEPIEAPSPLSQMDVAEDLSDTGEENDIDTTIGAFALNVSEKEVSEEEPIDNCTDDDIEETIGASGAPEVLVAPTGVFGAPAILVTPTELSEEEPIDNCTDDDIEETIGVSGAPEVLVESTELFEKSVPSEDEDSERTISGVSDVEIIEKDNAVATENKPKKQNKKGKFIIIGVGIIVLLISALVMFNNKNNNYIIDDNNIVDEAEESVKSSEKPGNLEDAAVSVTDVEERQSDIEENHNDIDSPSLQQSEEVLNISTTSKENNKKENKSTTKKQQSDTKETTIKEENSSELVIPDVSGKTESEAKELLKDYNVSVYYIYTNSVPKGYAIDTYPYADTVGLYISAGSGDSAWSNWSETKPSGSDVAYLENPDDFGRVGDGKGILVECKYRNRYRIVYIDRKTGEIVDSEAWSDWCEGTSADEGIAKLPTPSSEKYYRAFEYQNQTLYRWRADYVVSAD